MSESPGLNAAVRDVSEEELREYIEYLRDRLNKNGGAEAYPKAVMDQIAESIVSERFAQVIATGILALGARQAVLALWVQGFQLGREFENRLMAKAMREGK